MEQIINQLKGNDWWKRTENSVSFM